MEFIFAGAAVEVVVAITAVENIVPTPTGEGVVTAVAKESVSPVGAGEVVVGGVAELCWPRRRWLGLDPHRRRQWFRCW